MPARGISTPVPHEDPTTGSMRRMHRMDEQHPTPGWLLDELASAGRENLDAAHVERYDGKMDARAPEEVELLRSWGLDASSVVVDLGCGTGQFALTVASACRRVVAVDVSPVMRERLRAKRDQAGIHNVEIAAAGFLSYDHAGDEADIVYSRYALHHLPDFWKVMALRRVRAILRPGGIFRMCDVVYGFDPGEVAERIEAWCAPFGDEVEGDWARWEMEEHVRDEHSTFTWLLEAMFERTGFTIEAADYSDDGFDARYLLRATPP
jgi:SAM-dependent methyltransferase